MNSWIPRPPVDMVKIMQNRKIVGYFVYGDNINTNNVSFAMYKKPNWFHKLCIRLFFGIKWKDA